MRLRIQVDPKSFIEYKTAQAPDDFKEFMRGFLDWQCDLIKARIKEVVDRQLYTWSPLSISYKAFKERVGQSPKIWYASGQTMDAIRHWYSPLADAYFIGVHPTVRHRGWIKKVGIDQKKKGARIIKIIEWMEKGTRKMPARPLFSKVIAEFSTKKKQADLYAQYIKKQKGLT